MSPDTSQFELWSHFQTERLEVFEASKSRLEYLVKLAGKVSPGRTLLNIGCGSGHLEQFAKQKSWQVLSVDPDAQSVDRLKTSGVDARCGTIESLPIASESVHVVVSTEVFEHLRPDTMDTGLKEIQRVLAPGGALIGTVPYRERLSDNEAYCPHCKMAFHRWGHHQSFDELTMKSALEKYFSIRKVGPVFFAPWNVLDWKGKLSVSARLAFSFLGIHGSTSNLLFIAIKK
ncbi:MAG TPA: class I SAM-dependent methyltransferase [Candidatus Angelobacter sp.]|jgi:cyclopropane fatty-acyl-phospholipid synthase-like methyltransferase